MNGKRRESTVLVNVGLTAIALIFTGTVPFAFNLVVGRQFGVGVLGQVGVVLGLTLFLGQLSSTVGAAATKYIAEALGRGEEGVARATFQFLFLINLLVAGVFALLLLVGSNWIAPRLHVPIEQLWLGAALIIAYAFYLYLKSVYYGLDRVAAYAGNEIVSDILFFAALAAVVSTRAQAWLLVPFILNNLIFALYAGKHMISFFLPFDGGQTAPRRAALRYWLLTGGGTAASLGRSALGTTIVGLLLNRHAAGLYYAAIGLTAPLQLMPRALSLVLFATMARLFGEGNETSLRELLRQSTEWLVFVLGILSGLAVLNAHALLVTLYGARFASATVALQIIVSGAYLLMISGPSISVLSSTNDVAIPTVASITGLAVSLLLWFVLIPRFGIEGSALASTVGAAIIGGIPSFFAYRRLGARPSAGIRAALMLGTLIGVLIFLPGNPLPASALYLFTCLALHGRPVGQAVLLAHRKTLP